MVTKAPNDDARGRPAPDSGRNDPAIGPADQDGKQGTYPGPQGGRHSDKPADTGGDSSTAKGNAYSPDFEPKPTEHKPANSRDADIDTDGG